MRLKLLIVILSLITAPAFSQSPVKTEKIKKYMDAIGYTNLAKQSMESMFDLYEKNYPTVDTSGIRSH